MIEEKERSKRAKAQGGVGGMEGAVGERGAKRRRGWDRFFFGSFNWVVSAQGKFITLIVEEGCATQTCLLKESKEKTGKDE